MELTTGKNYEKILKVTLVGAFIGILFIYLNYSRPTPTVSAFSHTEIIKVEESAENEATTKADRHEDCGQSSLTLRPQSSNQMIKKRQNYFCRAFNSTGAITLSIRNERPGLLKNVNEATVSNDSIFFLETSCAEDLSPRQCCSVESAARTNPGKQVYVLFISPDASLGPDGGQNIQKLKSIYANIHFYYIDIINFTKGTKMEKWVANQTLMKSSFKVAHLSDGLRLLTLCKYGGIYFDLDVVVMHSLLNMSNFAGDEAEDTICNAVISMKANGSLVNACLDEYVNDYRGDLWSYNGPSAIERALNKVCKKKTRRLWKNCDGTFVIYPTTEFYPIPWQKWRLYFKEGNENEIAHQFGNSTVVHIWNKMSAEEKVRVGSNILYGEIASKYCPLSYWNSGKFF